jgi:hypothetical protein
MSSNNPESNDFITDTELQDLGISRELWEDWYLIMDHLWVGIQKAYPQTTMGENEIIVDNLIISANFVNSTHVEVDVLVDNTQYLMIRYANDPETVLGCVLAVIGSLSN